MILRLGLIIQVSETVEAGVRFNSFNLYNIDKNCNVFPFTAIINGKVVYKDREFVGRPSWSGTRAATVKADTVIAAMGGNVDTGLYTENGLTVDNRGRAVIDLETMESSVKNVFVVGDGQKGPGTAVGAIVGAAKAATAIQPFSIPEAMPLCAAQCWSGPVPIRWAPIAIRIPTSGGWLLHQQPSRRTPWATFYAPVCLWRTHSIANQRICKERGRFA